MVQDLFMKNRQQIIIQATPFCNIDCRYCYLPDRSSKKRITTDTLTCIAKALFASPYTSDNIDILWHAGEPLTMPRTFYEHAIDIFNYLKTSNINITHEIQTNGTLINQQWCDFFIRNNINVGVSIDGPEWIHNTNRINREGKGTFDKTLHGIRLLQQNKVPITTIMVVTSSALDFADQIWEFFIANGIHDIAFNPEEIEGINTTSSVYNEVALDKYYKFLDRITTLREKEKGDFRIRELDEFEQRIKYGDGQVISSLNNPFHIISFDYEGNVSTFCPELLSDLTQR